MLTHSENILEGKLIEGSLSARARIDGRDYINFFGAGYLALGRIPQIRNAVKKALDEDVPFSRQMPAGLGGRELVFERVENLGARAIGTRSSVYFATGYLIGAVGLASLSDEFDVIFLDEFAHANLYDAAIKSQRPIVKYAHSDPDSLRIQLKSHMKPKQRPLLMSDGAFATSGAVPPLQQYAELLNEYDGKIFIDESHSFGVVGKTGRGAIEHCGVEYMATAGATLSKSFCAHGAILGCSPSQALQLTGTTPIRGACSGSPLSAIAASESMGYFLSRPELPSTLRTTADYFRQKIRSIGIECIDTPAPIVTFQYGRRSDMRALQKHLFDKGIYIYHSSYFGAGSEGVIRCGIFRDHSKEDIDTLIDAVGAF